MNFAYENQQIKIKLNKIYLYNPFIIYIKVKEVEKTKQRFFDKMFLTLCEHALGKHFSLLSYSIAGWLEHVLFLIFIFSNSGWNTLKYCLSSIWLCIRTLIL